ncbi:hypothetical protein SGCOL_006643 [Colletotrichum sp. CLE4]
MHIRPHHLVLLIAALLCLVDYAHADRSYYTWIRYKCCNQPERLFCKESIEKYRFCQAAARMGGVPPLVCRVTQQWNERSRQACRPGIEGPPDWVDPDKPHRPPMK